MFKAQDYLASKGPGREGEPGSGWEKITCLWRPSIDVKSKGNTINNPLTVKWLLWCWTKRPIGFSVQRCVCCRRCSPSAQRFCLLWHPSHSIFCQLDYWCRTFIASCRSWNCLSPFPRREETQTRLVLKAGPLTPFLGCNHQDRLYLMMHSPGNARQKVGHLRGHLFWPRSLFI